MKNFDFLQSFGKIWKFFISNFENFVLSDDFLLKTNLTIAFFLIMSLSWDILQTLSDFYLIFVPLSRVAFEIKKVYRRNGVVVRAYAS